MHRLIFSTVILVFVSNGIACACPTEFSVPDHSTHQMHGDTGPENQTDCCDNCDNMSAASKSGEQTTFVTKYCKQSDFGTVNLYVDEIAWDEAHASQKSNIYRDKPTPPTTPVIFFDRMLD